MKKKYALVALILLIATLFMISFSRKEEPKVDKELIESQEKVVDNSIGKTSDTRIVVKLLESEDETYFIFQIENNKFTQYCYRFYKTKEDYDNWVKEYSFGPYELEKNDKALITKIVAQRGYQSGEKSLYDQIIENYSDTDKYEIIK